MVCLLAIMAVAFLHASAQQQERMNMPPGDNVVGKVTAVSKDSLTIAPLMGGDAVTVKVSDTSRVVKDRQPFKLEQIKVDDVVFARGELKNNSMQAAVVSVVNPEMIQRLQQGGGPGGGPGGGIGQGAGFNREDLGKKFILGDVKAINETKLTIARPDGQTQEIEVDENTSFKKNGESITLPDIKVGDFVRGRGELKDNTFVPKELIVGRPQMRLMMGGPGMAGPGIAGSGGAQPEQKKPDEAAPTGTPAPAPPK
ncbi:MAG TPA: DUF5666 domain-containing protein [Candidatus Angelobacter sp.]|nr:DUF5666 domain-containing protein [Candidatus Angelobacter sp.]